MASEAAEPQAVQGAVNDHEKENKFQQAIASWRSTHLLFLLILVHPILALCSLCPEYSFLARR